MNKLDFRRFTLAGQLLGFLAAAIGGLVGCVCFSKIAKSGSPPEGGALHYFIIWFLVPALLAFGIGFFILSSCGVKIYKSEEQLAQEQAKKKSIVGIVITIIFVPIVVILILFGLIAAYMSF